MRAAASTSAVRWLTTVLITLLVQALLNVGGSEPQRAYASAPAAIADRRVNVPNLTGAPFAPAIFWLGKVDPTDNYSDVRIYYYDQQLEVVVHTIDRLLWYDSAPTAGGLPNWDSVSIYLSQNGNVGGAPDSASYRLEIELYNDFRATYRGNGANWVNQSLPLVSTTTWRGGGGVNSGLESEGWVATFKIPFTSLGLPTAPPAGTHWGLGVVVHDRDDAAGTVRRNPSWPETMNPDVPSTWGLMHFGTATYAAPRALPSGTLTVRQGLNGATVVDGAVGGSFDCGNNGFNKWTDWGNANYARDYQFSIQNQWDVADWPCFSKFYIIFPLAALPPAQTFLSAAVTLNLLGTAGGGQWGPPPASYIEVFTVDTDWDPSTLTWNNAPLATENIAGTWVPPVVGTYSWNVSRAVAQAYGAGEPLRLAFYSIDGERHTGKYFYSSYSNDWNGVIRPTLTIEYGQPCDLAGPTCHFVYLPGVLR